MDGCEAGWAQGAMGIRGGGSSSSESYSSSSGAEGSHVS